MIDEVLRGEIVEKELDLMIERRSRQKDPDEEHELWRESVRRYNARHREAALRQRLEWHEDQLVRHSRTFELLLKRHRVGLRLCRQQLGIPVDEEERKTA